jgi:Ca-activated chloride channel family protein
MELKNPYVLWLLLLWIPMVWIYVRRETGTRPAVQFSDLSLVSKFHSSFIAKLRHIVIVLRLIGFGLLVIALARPRKGHTVQEVSTHGVDIVLVLDVSTSMKALDFKPKNRLFVAKETIKEFIKKRQHDRIGLVIFAGRSYTKCPLTLDYSILTQFIDEVKFNEIEDGTAIGTAIATAGNRLKQSDAKSRVIILLTDGANNKGEITPVVAAKAVGELDMKIYSIGVGREGMVPMPVDYVDRRTGRVVETKIINRPSDLDEQTLVNIASETKGRFFRANNPEKLKEIYNTIDELEKTEIKTKSYTTYSEHFFPWLIAGFILLLLELVLKHTRFRRIP